VWLIFEALIDWVYLIIMRVNLKFFVGMIVQRSDIS
jgi:hypothetical protein